MFLVVILVVLVGVLAWVAHRLAWAPRWPGRWPRVVVPLALVLLTGLSFLQFGAGPTQLSPGAARPFVWLGAVWLSVLLYLVLALVPVAFVSWLTGLSPRTDRRGLRRRIHRVGVPLAVVLALVVTGGGIREAGRVRITPRVVIAGDLPSGFDGLKVAVLSDLHVGPVRDADFTRQVVTLVNGARPDVVVIAGDLVDGPEWRYGPEIDPLKGLRAPLGVYAVTGNHETYTGTVAAWERRFRALGIHLLDNAHATLTRGPERIWLLGVRDFNATGALAPDYERPLARVGERDFALLVAHQPRAALRMQGGFVDLQVSGHTHGGQLWPFRTLVLMQQPMVDGRARIGDVDVVTSRGAGEWGPPVRVGAPPEVPLITLRKG